MLLQTQWLRNLMQVNAKRNQVQSGHNVAQWSLDHYAKFQIVCESKT